MMLDGMSARDLVITLAVTFGLIAVALLLNLIMTGRLLG